MAKTILAALGTAILLGTGPALAQERALQPPVGWAAKAGITRLVVPKPGVKEADPATIAAVQQTFARYATALDDGDTAMLRAVFTEDAQWTIQFWNGVIPARITGRDEIASTSERLLQSQGDQRRHLIGNILVQNVSRHSVDAIATGIVVKTMDNATNLAGSTVYSAKLRRGKDGVWRFSRLVVGLDSTEAGKGRGK